jgi:RNA-directed DNA polymerase
VYTRGNLESAWKQVRRNKGSGGIDKQSIAMFEHHASDRLDKLHDELQSGRYRANDIRRAYIEKSGSKKKRPLGIPTVKDRIVQTALRNAIQPIFERKFH